MPTDRGWAALAAGLALFVAARLVGSPDLQMVAVGIVALPLLAALFVRWTRVRLDVRRQLSAVRVFPGTRVVVTLSIENHGRATTSFLLLEDALPSALGKPARLVVSGIPPRNEQTVSYSMVCRKRGRFDVGPLTIYVADPFGLVRTKIQGSARSELIVYPETEDVEAGRLVSQGAGAGDSAVRQLYRSAAEFYTMREYVTGDDLRRIHWPSVARTGQLMIRQDESTRRSSAVVFLDNRSLVLGGQGSPGFERAVSITATLGRALGRAGFALRLATAELKATSVSEDLMLETLAGAAPAKATVITPALTRLRATGVADASLAFVSGPPNAFEVSSLTSVGTVFGKKLAVFVYPEAPTALAPSVREEMEKRTSSARSSLQRAGWEVFVVRPDERFAEVWRRTRKRKLRATAPLS